jgi:transposase
VICADELGPVIPRSFPPAPGWTAGGHWVKAVLDSGRGPEKTWVYGALRPGDGQEVTITAPSRNSVNYQRFLGLVEQANPTGEIAVITDNLSSHHSVATRTWLADHPRIQHAFIPTGACWLNLQEGWWRLFCREALAGQSLPPLWRSPSPLAWRPASSTPVPARGYGADHHRPHATDGASSSTGSKDQAVGVELGPEGSVVGGVVAHVGQEVVTGAALPQLGEHRAVKVDTPDWPVKSLAVRQGRRRPGRRRLVPRILQLRIERIRMPAGRTERSGSPRCATRAAA